MKDPIKDAIKASEPVEKHAQLNVTISSTGRHVGISFPVDMTDGELLEFVGWCGTNLRLSLAQERAKTPMGRLVVARGSVPRQ